MPGRALDLVAGRRRPRCRAARRGRPRRRAPASRPPRRGGPSCRGARRRPAPPRSSAPAGAPCRSAAPATRDPPGLGQLAVGVAGARAPAEPRRRQVGLRQAGEEALQRGSPGRAGRAAGRWRRGRGCRRGPPCSPRSRRTSATMSCEVIPAGLSQSSTAPSPAPGIRDRAGRRPRRRGTSTSSSSSRSVEKPAARLWPPPPVAAGDRRDVDVALAGAQADLAGGAAAVPWSRTSGGDLGPLDRAQVVDDPLGHLLAGAARLVVGGGDVGEDEAVVAVALDPVQGARDEAQLLDRHVLVEAAVGVVDLDPGFDQVGGDPVGAGVGVLVHELAGVGDQADVERRGDLRGELGRRAARPARRRSRPCRRPRCRPG